MCPSYHIHHIHPTHYNRILLYVRFLLFWEKLFLATTKPLTYLTYSKRQHKTIAQKSNLRLQKKHTNVPRKKKQHKPS